MKTKIKKWGNSLAVRLPKAGVDLLKLKEDSFVIFDFDYNKNQILIKPEEKKEYKLDELINKITPQNIHDEVEWSGPVGKEIW